MSFSQTRESGSEKVPSAPGYLVEKGIDVTRNGGGGGATREEEKTNIC